MNTIDEMIEVLQAMKEGKTVQWAHRNEKDWVDCQNLVTPSFGVYVYRVKKEPRRRWCVDAVHTVDKSKFVVTHYTREEAENYRKRMGVAANYGFSEIYEVVEVMK